MPNKGQGGVTASKGFEYQDYATLDAFLQNYMTPGFVGVQPENKNDFKVLNEDKNRVISGQVKSDVEAIGKVKEVVHKLPSNEPNYCIYLSHANNDLRRFIDGLNDRRKNNDTGLSIWIKKKIENIEDEDLLKIEKSDFIVVPEPSKEKYIIGTLATCLQNLKIIDVNFIDLENSLLRICAKCRSTQGIITKKDFLNAIDKHKKYVDLSVSIDITHNLYGLKADINAVIDTYIDKNDTSVGELRILKADVNSNNSDALIVSARLADNNPKYQILEKGVRLLFEKNTSKKVKYIPKELKNFANVINGIYALQNNNFELALELWQQIADYNEFKVNIKYLKGLTEYFLGNYEDAIKDLKRICDTQGDIHEVQCLCWYIIYLCKLNKYIFYSDFSELEKAHILDPKNKLVIVSLIDKYTFWGNFDEVINLFEEININNFNLDQKIKIYLCLLIAYEKLNRIELKQTMLELINLVASRKPKKDVYLVYVGFEYTQIYIITYENGYYCLRIDNNVANSAGHYDKKIGLGIGMDVSDYQLEVMNYRMLGKRISSEEYLLRKAGYPILKILDEMKKKDINKILKTKGIILNHDFGEEKEYVLDSNAKVSVNIAFYKTHIDGYVNFENRYMFSFKVDKQSDNSRLFEKKMNSACKILVIIEYKDTKMYFEVPKNFVHIS